MTREEKISHLKGILSEINENDNAVCYLTSEDNELIESAIEALSQEPCYNPDEWCHDCKEYDHDKHCCPRYNKVIRNAVKEIKQAKVGHWIYDKRIENWKCSECGCSPKTIGYVGRVEFMREHFKFCNHCGCRMVEPQAQESEDKE
jgi:hypothetical protein